MDAEVAATTERLQRIRCELAAILQHGSSAALPKGLTKRDAIAWVREQSPQPRKKCRAFSAVSSTSASSTPIFMASSTDPRAATTTSGENARSRTVR
jgi:hypothetical protein